MKKPKYRKCKDHPKYDGSYMPVGRCCADCYLIWYNCGQKRDEAQENVCLRRASLKVN